MPNRKRIAEQINKLLDRADAPVNEAERADAFSQIFGLTRFESRKILNGLVVPSLDLLEKIAEEFEVKVSWITGESTRK